MGPSPPNEQPAIDTFFWRTQLQSDERERIVYMITETLKKQHLPFSGPEGINEHRKIASRFEEKVFRNAANLNDYLRKISIEMLSIETTVKNADGSSTSIPTTKNITPLNSGYLALNTGDWRAQQPPDSRQKNINKLMETLKKHVPYSGEDGIDELMRIAVSFEELIFNTALNQVDYFRKISFKIVAMEEGN